MLAAPEMNEHAHTLDMDMMTRDRFKAPRRYFKVLAPYTIPGRAAFNGAATGPFRDQYTGVLKVGTTIEAVSVVEEEDYDESSGMRTGNGTETHANTFE